jgi:AcrR family transcriptional regulator
MYEAEIKDRILSTSADSIMRYGIKRFTMDEIAEKLGISKKTIYSFFRSKKELIEAAMDREFQIIYKEQDENMLKAETLPDKVLALLFPVFRLTSKIDRIMLEELVKYYPDIWSKIDEKRQERIRQISAILTREADPMYLGGLKPELVSNFILTSITGFINPENLTKLGITPAEAFTTVFTMIVRLMVGPEKANEFIEKIRQSGMDNPGSTKN